MNNKMIGSGFSSVSIRRMRRFYEMYPIWSTVSTESFWSYFQELNSVEFDGFRKSAGLHTFTLSVTEWYDKTNAIGIYSKRGKYGGTYAHKDIAFEFASAISPVFKLYLIKEFEILSTIAKYQLDVLNNAEKIKLLIDAKKEGDKDE